MLAIVGAVLIRYTAVLFNTTTSIQHNESNETAETVNKNYLTKTTIKSMQWQ